MSNWKEYILGDLGHTYTGLSGKNKDDFGKGKPYIPYLNIFTNSRIDPSFLDYVDVKQGEKQNTVKSGDLFFTTSSETVEEVGMTAVLLDDLNEAYLNSFCFGFRLNNFDILLPKFARFLFRSEIVRKKISDLGQGSTRFNLPKTELLQRLKIKIPSKPVQLKIAEILCGVEAVIDKTNQTIAKYKCIKQGMLQDLFTRGIGADGNLRPTLQQAREMYKPSASGLIPKEWEIKTLEQICSMKSGEGITSKSIQVSGNYPVYGGNGLRGYTDTFTHEGEFTLVGRQGALCGNITRVGGQFYASEHAVVVTVEYEMDVDWLSQKLDTLNLNQYSEASAQPGLSVAKILKLKVLQPPYDEQKLIAQRLLAVDKKILQEEKYLLKIISLKQGLMADILTGKKEVKINEELVSEKELMV